MRAIKFRAWDDGEKRWLHGYEPGGMGCNICGEVIALGGWLSEVPLERYNDVVIEQYIGLTDKNGREIYEGDILEFRDFDGVEPSIDLVVIEWGFGGWMGRYDGSEDTEMIDDLCIDGHVDGTVIDNIHDNPELMEATTGDRR